MKLHAALLFALLTLAVGCASTEPKRESFAQAQGTMTAADQLGAKRLPQAALYLQLAREEYARSKALLDDSLGYRASLMLQRSQVDADLALALLRAQVVDSEASDASQVFDEFQQHDEFQQQNRGVNGGSLCETSCSN